MVADNKGGRDKNPHAVPWHIFLVFFLLIIGIAGAGIAFYLNQKSHIESDERQDLNVIAMLKVNQIENWLSERIGDGRLIQESRWVMDELRLFLVNPADQKKGDDIRRWLESVKDIYGYQNALLIDAAGRVLLSALPKGASIDPEGLDLIAAARRSGRVMLSELHRSLGSQVIYQDMVIPVLGSPFGPGAEAGAASVDLGAVLLRIDPYRFLYPLIQSWPRASESAETLLVKKEGNEVLYLNELRHRKNTALTLRLPIIKSDLPAALAVRGVSGVIEGMDYRGVPVLAALRPIPGTSWFMVAKVDKQELFSGLRNTGLAILAICLLLLVSSGSTVVILWLRQSRRTLRKEHEAELKRRALARHFDYLVRYANDILILADTNSRIVEVNDQAVRSFGYSREELLNLHLQDLRPKEQKADLARQMKQAVRHGGLIYETVHRRKDGSTFSAEVSARVIDVEGRAFYQHIIRDISERKRAQETLRESEERYRGLFENMAEGCAYCRMIFENDKPRDFVYLAVNAAFETLTGLKDVAGKRVTEVIPGIRETDPELLAAYGRVSLTGKPEKFEIMVAALKMWFSISVYSPEKGFFVEVFDIITKRKQAEEALRQSEYRLRRLYESGLIGVIYWNVRGQITAANDKFLEIVGYTRDDLENDRIDWANMTPPELRYLDDRSLVELRATGINAKPFEKEYIRKDGTRLPIIIAGAMLDEERFNGVAFVLDISERKRAEEAYRESMERYQRTLDNMLEGSQIIGFDMRYLYLNDAAARHGRLPKERLLGRTMMEVYPGIETTEMFAALQRCLDDRTPISMENKFTYADGTSGYFELSIQPAPDGVFILSIDITAHKLAEEALRKSQQQATLLAGLLERSSQPFAIGYPDGSLGIFNASFLDLVGYTKEEMKAIDWNRDLTPPEWHEIESAMLEDLLRKGLPVRYEKEYFRRDGSRVPIELLVHLARDEKGRPKHYFSFITDITERKRAEDAIRQLNAELEHRVLERTAELESANRELEAFSYSISHDLRTPLRAIDGFSRIVFEEYASALDPEARRLLGVIRSNTQHMGQLIDDLLDFSRLGHTEVHRARIDMTSMVRSVFEELLPPGEAGKTEFRVGSLPDAFSDPALIRQVWANLLSNAIKFSGKTEKRVVEVGGGTDGRENLYFVQDNGVGFDMRYNDKLFGVFQRLHTVEEFEGTGVGLAIIQRIIQRLGGRVWAQGRIGAGATFSFSLPLLKANDMEEQHG